MSGHSKWATIRRKKEKTDAARGKVFTKIIKEITIAAKLGGSNEEANPRLKVAIQKAKDANMPAASMERARLKGAGELSGVVYEDVTYEGYAAGGIAVVVETMTDNKQRTVAEVRHAFNRCEGNMGASGSVSWMFHKRGMIVINAEGVDEDILMDDALEAGAEDVKKEDGIFEIYTLFEDYLTVCDTLDKKYTLESNEFNSVQKN